MHRKSDTNPRLDAATENKRLEKKGGGGREKNMGVIERQVDRGKSP